MGFLFLFLKKVKSFLNKHLNPTPTITTVPKDIRYIKLPYQGNYSYNLKDKLLSHFKSLYPQVDFRFIFINTHTIKSFFPHKDKLPEHLRSKIIYKFECGTCQVSYIGSSKRSFHERRSEHLGISFLTGAKLTNPKHSAVRKHSDDAEHPINADDFKIIGSVREEYDLRTLESLFIRDQKPTLNENSSAYPLYTV